MINDNEKDSFKLSIQNNPCGVCRAVGTPPPCKGHGRTGGGSGSSGDSDRPPTKETPSLNYSNQNMTSVIETNHLINQWKEALKPQTNSMRFELGSLDIQSDQVSGILIFTAKNALSKEELESIKKVFNMIKAEFDEFKESLQEQGIPTHSFICNLKENELTIKIPNPKYYAGFIQRLAERNLLPSPVNNHKHDSYNSHYKTPTPFDISTGPKPKGWKE